MRKTELKPKPRPEPKANVKNLSLNTSGDCYMQSSFYTDTVNPAHVTDAGYDWYDKM